jgi:MFS family permease
MRKTMGNPEARTPSGLRTFIIIWSGQMVSLLGSGLAAFALGVWVFQTTGSATAFALITFFAALPAVLVTPVIGVVVDRWDRRIVLMISATAAASTMAAVLVLAWLDQLEIWHLYVLIGIGAMFTAVQMPAFSATTPLLVPKRHLGRAAGLTQAAVAAPRILAPLLAGALLAVIHLEGILAMDLALTAFAVVCLALVRFPKPPETAEGKAAAKAPFRRQMLVGWEFIRKRPGLFSLLLLFACTNFASGMMHVLITPLILSFADAKTLGIVVSIAGAGFLLGGLTMSVWGGPKQRVVGILVSQLIQGVILVLGGTRENPWFIAGAAFLFMFTVPIVVGCAQAIWQVKVPPDLMGRVFAVRMMVAFSTLPLAYLLAGPLADYVFEPALAEGGVLADTVGAVIGVGPGRGIGFQLMLVGGLLLLIVAVAVGRSRLRRLEADLPDYIEEKAAVGGTGETGETGAGAIAPHS